MNATTGPLRYTLVCAECERLKSINADLLAALKAIARGDYDNAHDCRAAAKVAHAAIEKATGAA